MKSYRCFVSLLLVSSISAIQFHDDSTAAATDDLPGQQNLNLGHETEQRAGFFPANDAPDDRYSEISGIKYVDPQRNHQNYYDNDFNDNRKQLNFNGDLPRPVQQSQVLSSPPASFYYQQQQQQQQSPFRPQQQQKRPAKFPYQFVGPSSAAYYSTYPTDLSNPFYQNYANYYQQQQQQQQQQQKYVPDYYNPTRYPSHPQLQQQASNVVYGHQQMLHQQQPSVHRPNYATATNNYANQFGYPSIYGNPAGGGAELGGGLSSILNGIRGSSGLGQFAQVGGQFGKALEDISANDDLQCVPKLLCQMIRRRPSQLPSFLNVPGLTAIISALPSSSPLMNFGRAALLGLSGGECDATYSRCPRNEDQLLYYLNNHRGGFFRFFNSGNSFGDDSFLQSQIQQLSQQQQQGGSGGASQLNLLALQALAGVVNQGGGGGGGGINLGNLFGSPSNQYPVQQHPSYQPNYQQADQSSGLLGMLKPSALSDVVSNLLTGVIGNRFSRRKRSLPDEQTLDDDLDASAAQHEGHKIEKRIINLKTAADPEQSVFFGQQQQQQQQHQNSLEVPFTFSNGQRVNLAFPESGSSVQLPLQSPPTATPTPTAINQGNFISPSDVAKRLKMLFPDRTGTGYLRFDSAQFDRELMAMALLNDNRFGKILTGLQQQQSNNNNYQGYLALQSYLNANSNQNYPQQQQQQQQQYAGSSNYNNIGNYVNRQQQQSAGQSNLVYVTNSQGQIEYTLNELTGEKKRY